MVLACKTENRVVRARFQSGLRKLQRRACGELVRTSVCGGEGDACVRLCRDWEKAI